MLMAVRQSRMSLEFIIKIRYLLLVILVLTGLSSACNSVKSSTSSPHGNPVAPTVEVVTPPKPSPTPRAGSYTPTAEIATPVVPSPTPAESVLPGSCQATDLNVQIDRAAGYCFAYPKRFTFGTQPLFNIPAVQDPAIGSATDPVFATFSVEVAPYNPDQSLDQQANEYLKEFTSVAPESLTHTPLIVAGEPAVMVDQVPVYLNRLHTL